MSETSTETRPAPGELIYVTPECPLCGENVSSDGDSFWCEPCGASWSDRPSSKGEWEPDSAQCPKVLTHGEYEILSGRCVLSDGHGGPHNNDRTRWDPVSGRGGVHVRADLIDAAAREAFVEEWTLGGACSSRPNAIDAWSRRSETERERYRRPAAWQVAAVLPLVADAIEARKQFWGKPGGMAIDDAADLVRGLLKEGQ